MSLLFCLTGCATASLQPLPTPVATVVLSAPTAVLSTPPPATTVPTATVPPTPVVTPDTGWQLLRPGLERRVLNLTGEDGRLQESVYLLRIEPAGYHFDIAYSPGQPRSIGQWQKETGAFLLVNGGFFTEGYQATGLIITAGQASGVSYVDFGGMLAITPAGPEVRSLVARPYDPAEPLQAALQAFPMLVHPGGERGFTNEDGQRARRTVVAQDNAGRILFIVVAGGSFTLAEMSTFLLGSDLDLAVALNLDGGSSTAVLLTDPPEGVTGFSPLPAVITVNPRVE